MICLPSFLAISTYTYHFPSDDANLLSCQSHAGMGILLVSWASVMFHCDYLVVGMDESWNVVDFDKDYDIEAAEHFDFELILPTEIEFLKLVVLMV